MSEWITVSESVAQTGWVRLWLSLSQYERQYPVSVSVLNDCETHLRLSHRDSPVRVHSPLTRLTDRQWLRLSREWVGLGVILIRLGSVAIPNISWNWIEIFGTNILKTSPWTFGMNRRTNRHKTESDSVEEETRRATRSMTGTSN